MDLGQIMDREIERCGVTKHIRSGLPGDIYGDIEHIEILEWSRNITITVDDLVENVKTILNKIKKANPAWKPKDIIVEIKQDTGD